MSESKTGTIKVDVEDRDRFNLVGNQNNLVSRVLFGYLVDHLIEYDMMNPNWIENLLSSRFHDYLIKEDIDYKKQFERDKYKSILKIQEKMISKKLDIMPKDQAAEFIDQILGSPENAGDLIDRITSTQVFRINNESKMVQPDADGKPRILGIPPSQIVRCDQGFHTAMNECRSCKQRLTCPIRKGFIVDWLAIHGTLEQQEYFIDTGRFTMPALDLREHDGK